MVTIFIIVFKHAAFGFSFDKINAVVQPFYRNHVNYACLMALFFPIVWLATSWYKRWSILWWTLIFGAIVMIVGIYFSYTRAAYGALLIALASYLIIKFRLIKIALVTTAIGAVYFLVTWQLTIIISNTHRTTIKPLHIRILETYLKQLPRGKIFLPWNVYIVGLQGFK